MVKTFMILIIGFLISFAQSNLTEEQRKNLRKKVTKPLSAFYGDQIIRLKSYYDRGDSDTNLGISYDASKIRSIINENGFPESYNFIEAENPTVNIKNQGSCGSCWAFATTTALSYRLHKKNIDVDLSPQYGISCNIRSCEDGDYAIDANFNLVKNGTVTSECLPYSSGDGIHIEECPLECKDGSDFTKYHAKNAYATSFGGAKENYYDIVTLIMDELVTNGPVFSGIVAYNDFTALTNNIICKNIIFKHDPIYFSGGGHAVVIVGYGSKDDTFYWIIQNSWGERFCDNGFAKVEFGQINIENVIITEPFIEENTEGTSIDIKFNEIDEKCFWKFTSSSDIENPFELTFKKGDEEFYYQCGASPQNSREGICSFKYSNLYSNTKGQFTYNSHSPLLVNNIYNLDFSSTNNNFYYYGMDYIDSVFDDENKNIYVSDEGSKIVLLSQNPQVKNDRAFVSKIYPNKNSNTPLSHCYSRLLDDGYFSLIICELTSNELNLFSGSTSPLAYNLFCGEKEEMLATVYNLDKSRYPVFKIKKIYLPEKIYYNSLIKVEADIEGSLSGYSKNNEFGFIYEYEEETLLIECETGIPSKIQTGYTMSCYMETYYYSISSDDVKIQPYAIPFTNYAPFEVKVDDDFELEETEEIEYYRPSFQTDVNVNLFFLNLILFLLL